MQQGTAVKLKTCNEMGRCNKMLMRAATVACFIVVVIGGLVP